MTCEQNCDRKSLIDSWHLETNHLRRGFRSHSSSCLKSSSAHGSLTRHVWPEIPLSPVVLAPRAWEGSASRVYLSTPEHHKTSPGEPSKITTYHIKGPTVTDLDRVSRIHKKRKKEEGPTLSTKTKWIIILTATTLILMSVLLVGVTLRMAPVIDELESLHTSNYNKQPVLMKAALYFLTMTRYTAVDLLKAGMRSLRGVKNAFKVLFLLLIGQGVIHTGDGWSTNRTDKQILDSLLEDAKYDHRVRPSDLTCINVSVVLLSLSSPDESSLEYDVEFLVHQMWYDPRLIYNNTGRYQYLNALKHFQNIWTPDTYFINHGKLKEPLIPINIALQVYPNGRVCYTQRKKLAMNCQGNLNIFPFDNPKCSFAFESVSHEESEVKLDWNTLTPDLKDASSLRTHNAYLIKNETGICDQRHTWRGNYSCLTVLLVFTRDKSYYYTVVFVPGTLLVTSSFLSFWLDINAVPARVMIGVTTMLNFCTTTNSFRSTLPVVSDLNAMNMWDGVSMFFIYISLLEFIVVNYLYRLKEKEEIPSSPISNTDQTSYESKLKCCQVGRWCRNRRPGRSHKVEPRTKVCDISTMPAPSFDNKAELEKETPLFARLRGSRNTQLESFSYSGLAKKIDTISKVLFPTLFFLFAFGFFINYAVIQSADKENWVLTS
ncbi:glutamate-gated chloride channel-like [Tachypleus tridentatus]|uniref:glutamate-gated chloride channel-like n=1 Tax=Tachypleus tridentatus TaxID=6853 RepID=UPI003FD3DFFA